MTFNSDEIYQSLIFQNPEYNRHYLPYLFSIQIYNRYFEKKKSNKRLKTNRSALKIFQTYNASGRHQVHLVPRGLHH